MSSNPSSPDSPDIFATTRWTAVLRAGDNQTVHARAALSELCQTYWFPLYAYVRRRGHSPPDAEDLTQGFFARLLRLNSLAEVSPARGKFRAFLLASINHYLANERERAQAGKRDQRRTISLDAEEAEHHYTRELTDPFSPERLFDRQWALTLLDAVVQRLKQEYEAAGRGALFLELRFAITLDKAATPYAELAARLGMSEAALRVAVHRLRARYREVLREEIAQTVNGEAEVSAELRDLWRILSS